MALGAWVTSGPGAGATWSSMATQPPHILKEISSHFLQTLGGKQSQWGLTQQSSPLALKFTTRFLHIIKPQEPFYKCHHHSLLIFYIKNCIHSLQNFYVNIISSPLCHLSVYLKNKKKKTRQFSRSTTGWGREGEKRDTRGKFILCTEMQRKFHTALETALRRKKKGFRQALILVTALYQKSAHTCTNKIAKQNSVATFFKRKKLVVSFSSPCFLKVIIIFKKNIRSR